MPTAIRRIRRFGLRVGLQGDWYLYLIAAGIGLFMGVAATLFLAPLRSLEHFEAATSGTVIWIIVLAGPAIGGVLVADEWHHGSLSLGHDLVGHDDDVVVGQSQSGSID